MLYRASCLRLPQSFTDGVSGQDAGWPGPQRDPTVVAVKLKRPYASEWGERVLMRGGRGRDGQVTPPAWSNTRRR